MEGLGTKQNFKHLDDFAYIFNQLSQLDHVKFMSYSLTKTSY